LILYDRYRDQGKKYKILLNSKSHTFSEIRIQHQNYQILRDFKNELERIINFSKRVKIKNEEVMIKVNNERQLNLSKLIGNDHTCYHMDITENSRASLNLFQKLQEEIKNEEDMIKEEIHILKKQFLYNIPFESKKFEQLHKYDYIEYTILNKNKVLCSDLEILQRNLCSLKDNTQESTFNKLDNIFQEKFKNSNNGGMFISSLLTFFCIICFLYLLYSKNYFNLIFLIPFIVSLLYMEFGFEIGLLNIIKNNNKNLLEFTMRNQYNPEALCYLKSTMILNVNIFVIKQLLQDFLKFKKWRKHLNQISCERYNGELSDNKIKYDLIYKHYLKDGSTEELFELNDINLNFYHNVNKNENKFSIIMAEQIKGSEMLNLFILESNPNNTKAHITFISCLKNNYPIFFLKSQCKILKNFSKFVKNETSNTLFSSEGDFLIKMPINMLGQKEDEKVQYLGYEEGVSVLSKFLK
jgi:hypothetical protein